MSGSVTKWGTKLSFLDPLSGNESEKARGYNPVAVPLTAEVFSSVGAIPFHEGYSTSINVYLYSTTSGVSTYDNLSTWTNLEGVIQDNILNEEVGSLGISSSAGDYFILTCSGESAGIYNYRVSGKLAGKDRVIMKGPIEVLG